MTDEITLSMRLAELAALWHWIFAFYLVFLSERLTPFLAFVAIVKAALGTVVYLLVRRPQWAVDANLYEVDALVPIAVVLLLLMSIILTVMIWKAYDLQRPDHRIRELFRYR